MRILPDWILSPEPHAVEEEEESLEAVMLENTREAIKILAENEWKKDWGEWNEEEEDVLFELCQSSVMDIMTVDDVLEIIFKVKGEFYLPRLDDREGLIIDLRSCLADYCASHEIPYFE